MAMRTQDRPPPLSPSARLRGSSVGSVAVFCGLAVWVGWLVGVAVLLSGATESLTFTRDWPGLACLVMPGNGCRPVFSTANAIVPATIGLSAVDVNL